MIIVGYTEQIINMTDYKQSRDQSKEHRRNNAGECSFDADLKQSMTKYTDSDTIKNEV